mmetsp:Transcript_12483/g.44147  ORF Transcript_12483/g.44147 Transcript_12483/m.44147 type:complete len:88 (+) Transcript_12483:1316-1579(+)
MECGPPDVFLVGEEFGMDPMEGILGLGLPGPIDGAVIGDAMGSKPPSASRKAHKWTRTAEFQSAATFMPKIALSFDDIGHGMMYAST